jgi:hypothetical protein
MPIALVAALLGAVVAFGGTYLLQRAQFRRAELEAVQDRIGIARALRADLYVAKLSTQNSLKTQAIPPGMQYPTDLWIAQGHGIMKAIEPAAQGCSDAGIRPHGGSQRASGRSRAVENGDFGTSTVSATASRIEAEPLARSQSALPSALGKSRRGGRLSR